jgi:hypothetical protein
MLLVVAEVFHKKLVAVPAVVRLTLVPLQMLVLEAETESVGAVNTVRLMVLIAVLLHSVTLSVYVPDVL